MGSSITCIMRNMNRKQIMESVEEKVYRLNVGDYYSVIRQDEAICFVYGFSGSAGFLFEETLAFAKRLSRDRRYTGHRFTVEVYMRNVFSGPNSFNVVYSRDIN